MKIKMDPYSMMHMRGGFRGGPRGGFHMRGMMRGPWTHFPYGTEREYFPSPFEFEPPPCRGHCRGGRHTSLHRRGTEEQKRKSRDQDEEEIVIDDSSEEAPEAECENVEANSFEVQVYMRGCDPDNIKISIKDGLLRIEGSNKLTDTNSIFIRHEQTIPESVSIDNLKAFLHPEGLLTIGQMEEGSFPIQIKFEKKTLLQDLSIS
ncbi:UNVERIFIED_CONTAM: hypothetical protein RMT77_017750 [Armadillidium vulgare]